MPDTMTVRERREVTAFRAVELRYFGHLHLQQGAEPAVEVEGDPEVVAKVRTRAMGDTLVLEIGESWLERLTSGVLLVANRPLHYHVTVPELDRVAVSGAGKVEASGLTADELELTASGSADIAIGGLTARALNARISGRGTFRLAGRADAVRLRISGSGDVEAGELYSDDTEVRISGQGNVTVRVARALDVRISGLGHVRYHGDPAVTQQISGSGTVTRIPEAATSD
jgi:hypothetical protein